MIQVAATGCTKHGRRHAVIPEQDRIQTVMTPAEITAALGSGDYSAEMLMQHLIRHYNRMERELVSWQTELSKVMPADFKDWWENSKAEWPLIARLAIEAKNRSTMFDAAAYAELERTLAAERELADRLAECLELALAGWDSAEWIAPIDPAEVECSDQALAAWTDARALPIGYNPLPTD